jgi:poly(A) polymerase
MSALDSKCLRSLNGYRATEELLRFVGQQSVFICREYEILFFTFRLVPNVEQFRLALRAVKLWAKSQGLYSNTLGFLGGFSWAVLVAKACVTYPEVASVAQLLHHFFELFAKWKWPAPVVLTTLDSGGPQQQSSFVLQSWNPERNHSERHQVRLDRSALRCASNKVLSVIFCQVMPIITPTFPHLNSTFNVSLSTQRLVQGKMVKAVAVCQDILEGKENWNSLFEVRGRCKVSAGR